MPIRAVNNVLFSRLNLIFLCQHVHGVRVHDKAFWGALMLYSFNNSIQANILFLLSFEIGHFLQEAPPRCVSQAGRSDRGRTPGGKRSRLDFANFNPNLISLTLSREPKRAIGGWKAVPKSCFLMEEINAGYTWQPYQNSGDLRPKSRLA